MVTRIKFYKEDPNKAKRGEGIYYLRGPVTNKLKELGYQGTKLYTRDFKVLSQGWNTDKVGIPVSTKYPHISDGRIKRWDPTRKKRKV